MEHYEHEPVAEYNGGGEWSLSTWVACVCGWNKNGDEKISWREHFAQVMRGVSDDVSK